MTLPHGFHEVDLSQIDFSSADFDVDELTLDEQDEYESQLQLQQDWRSDLPRHHQYSVPDYVVNRAPYLSYSGRRLTEPWPEYEFSSESCCYLGRPKLTPRMPMMEDRNSNAPVEIDPVTHTPYMIPVIQTGTTEIEPWSYHFDKDRSFMANRIRRILNSGSGKTAIIARNFVKLDRCSPGCCPVCDKEGGQQ